MQDPQPGLTSRALLVLYNQLTLQEKIAFDHELAAEIRMSQLRTLGVNPLISRILAGDSWFETELRAITQDCVVKYANRFHYLQKRAKFMALVVDNEYVRSLFIKCHTHGNDDGEDWQPYDLEKAAGFKVPITRWYVEKLPDTNYEALVVHEDN